MSNANGELFDVVFNETGEFEGEASVSGERYGWVRVQAEGTWAVRTEEG